MAVHVDIDTQFDQRSVLQSANDMHRTLQRQGDETADKWAKSFEKASPRVRKAYEDAYTGAAKASSTLRAEEAKLDDVRQRASKSAEELAQKEARLEHFRTNLPNLTDTITAKERELVAIRQQHSSIMTELTVRSEAFARAQLSQGSAASDLGRALQTVESGADGAATSLGSIGRFGAPAIAAIAAGIVELTSVASAASGVIGLLPAAVGGAAAAFGTLKLATVGFDQAMKDMGDPKKFAQDLQGLSPAAQQAALAIEHLMPAFTQLKNATQEAFFSGIGPELTKLTTTLLPTVRAATTMIAGSFNEAFKSIGGALMSPEVQANLLAFAQNIGNTFRNLVPAVAPLTTAFAELARVGSGFMPQLAQAASQAAQSFANFIDQASKSGQLQQWIQEGITVLRQMMSVVGELTRLFLSLGPEGVRVMNEISTAVRFTSDAIRALNGDVGGLKDLFPTMGDIAVNVFNRIGSAIDTFLLGPLRLLGNVPGFSYLKDLHIQQITTPHLTSGAPGGGPGLGVSGGQVAYPSGDPNKPMQWVPGQGWQPAFGGDGGGDLPVPAGAPGVGSGFGGGSASMRLQPYTWGNPPPKGASGGRLPTEPQVPYDSTLPPGYANLPQTAAIYGAENSYLDAKNALAQKQARLNQIEHDNTATADDVIKARNDVINAQQAQTQAELRLSDARTALYAKENKALNEHTQALGEFGAKLDQDFGISKGLPGIAENLTKFLGNLIAAPFLSQMNALANAPGQAQGGFGLIGIAGAQGAFGPQYTAAGQAAAASSGSPGAATLGPGGVQSGLPAPLANTHGSHPQIAQIAAIAQSFGLQFTAGKDDHAADGGYHPKGMAGDFSNSSGNSAQELAFAQYMAQNFGPMLQELIYSDPSFNQLIGGGKNVTGTGYYSPGVLAEHTNHVHVAMTDAEAAQLGGLGRPPSAGGGQSLWDAVAQAEASGNWQNRDTGHNGHYGGLQFSPSTWATYGGIGNPADATREQQIDIANRTAFTGYNGTAPQGLGAWETIAKGMVPGVNVNTPASAFGGGVAGAGLPGMQPGSGVAPQQSFGGLPIPLPVTIVGGLGGNAIPGLGAPGTPPPGTPGAPAPGAPGAPGTGGGPGDLFGPANTNPGLNNPPAPSPTPLPGTTGIGPLPGPGAAPGQNPLDIFAPAPAAPGAGHPGPPQIGGGGNAFGAGGPMNTAPGTGPTQIGGVDPLQGTGKGGVGMSEGGSLDTALGLAASAVPGLGQAAQTGMKLANRAIQYGGQVAGILTQGALDTWLPMGGSKLAQNNWLTRIVGGLAGAAPALPNMAGKPAAPPPQGQGQDGQPPQQGGDTNITVNNQRATEDGTGKDIAWHQGQAALPAGRP